jgi:hypothetical protein
MSRLQDEEETGQQTKAEVRNAGIAAHIRSVLLFGFPRGSVNCLRQFDRRERHAAGRG